MKPERWQQLDNLFNAARERAPDKRSAFLDEACDDPEVRREVEALLAAHEQAASFIDSPALYVEARLMGQQSLKEPKPSIGQTIGHYHLLAPLGSGGMGDVYLVQDTKLGSKRALKILPAHFTSDIERLRRFEQEARTASALNHPNIVTIYEIGHDGAFHFIAEEFIEGVTLSEYLHTKRPGLNDIIEIAMQTASALAAAHAKGIVHRDIKPANIMVQDGQVLGRPNHIKVLDFGIAKLAETEPHAEATTRMLVKTSEGMVIGTASYMSPEQARGLPVDERTDIWSLGIVLYEMLTGDKPFRGDTSEDLRAAILRDHPPAISTEVPDRLRWIVEKALRKDREERYQTIKEMFSDLREISDEHNERELAHQTLPRVLTSPEPTHASRDEPVATSTPRTTQPNQRLGEELARSHSS